MSCGWPKGGGISGITGSAQQALRQIVANGRALFESVAAGAAVDEPDPVPLKIVVENGWA